MSAVAPQPVETASGSITFTYQIASGRLEWLSRDPITENGGINLYAYVGNNPLNYLDASGLAPQPAPTLPSGKPAPPPIPPRNGKDGSPNKWVPVPGSDGKEQRQKWKPEKPCPGSQPGASWDGENGHWDVDDGYGNRERYLPDGTLVDHNSDPIQVFPSITIDPNPSTLTVIVGGFLVAAWAFVSGAGAH